MNSDIAKKFFNHSVVKEMINIFLKVSTGIIGFKVDNFYLLVSPENEQYFPKDKHIDFFFMKEDIYIYFGTIEIRNNEPIFTFPFIDRDSGKKDKVYTIFSENINHILDAFNLVEDSEIRLTLKDWSISIKEIQKIVSNSQRVTFVETIASQ